MRDHWVEGAVLVIGGTAVLDAQRGRADDLVLHHLDEARFANPCLPTQHYDVAQAGLDLRPAFSQYAHFMLASHQGGEAPRDCDIEALLHLGLTHDLVDLEGRGHAFERLGPEILAGEDTPG